MIYILGMYGVDIILEESPGAEGGTDGGSYKVQAKILE